MMAGVFARVWTSAFARNVASLTAGHLAATAIPIVAAPMLGRLYTPEDYGYFGQYMSVAMVLGVLSAGQYPQVIVIEKREASARALAALAVGVTVIVSLLTAAGAAIVVTSSAAVDLLGPYRAWIWTLPAATFATGTAATLSAVANRAVRYRQLALAQVAASLCSVITALFFGRQGAGAHGLFAAFFAAQTLFLVSLAAIARDPGAGPLTFRRLRFVAFRYREQPLFSMPGQLVNTVTGYMPTYGLMALGDTAAIGNFNRAFQLLIMPLGLVGQAVSQVFRQRAAADLYAEDSCWPVFKKTAFALTAISVGPTLALGFFAPAVFSTFLGPRWYGAGEMARILVPMLMLKTIASPLSTIFILFGRQRQELRVMLTSCILTITLVCAAYGLIGTSTGLIIAYCAGQCIMYTIYVVRSVGIARQRKTR